ncbi:MAG TPA: CoA transferase [Acidimicrobiales bacterium]|nr:CoA transferase [Acidimicrobiales bacterium]
MRALDGIRVVDFGQHLAPSLAAMILADHGADVVRVDPPTGPRWTTDAHAVLERGKRRIALDLKDTNDLAIARRLIERAEVVIEGFRPGVMERLGLLPVDRNVWCSIPGFASDDPRAGLAGWEGIVGAATGHYTRSPREPGDGPAFSAVPLASSFASLVAVNSIVAALIARERSGQGQTIEVPLFGAMFEAIGGMGQRLPVPPVMPFTPCSDIDAQGSDGRWIHVVMISPRHYEWFRDAFLPELGPPDLDARQRIIDLIATAPAASWDERINAVGIPCTIVRTTEQFLREDEHARAVRAVIELDDPELGPTAQLGFGVSMSRTPPSASPRHAHDADRNAILRELDDEPVPLPVRAPQLRAALEGITVIDLTMVLAGPSAGRILAEFGADVIKINRPAYWIIGHCHTNSGKRSVLLDVRDPEGREALLSLVRGADAFLQNIPEGGAEAIGIGEDDVRAVQPDIVYSSVSAYGHGGTRGRFRGWEPIGQASTGLMMRYGGGVPRFARFAVCDYGTGHLSAMAVLLGLFHKVRTGEGQHVATSLVQAGAHHQAMFMVAYEGKVWDEPAGYDVLGWSDDDRLCDTPDGWLYRVGDVTHPLVEIEGLMEDEEVRRQGLSIERDHPGFGRVRLVGPSPRLSRTPVQVTKPAPAPGWDTREVLGARYEELASRGVAADSLPDDVMVVW